MRAIERPRQPDRRCIARTLRAAAAALWLFAALALAEQSGRFEYGLLWEITRPDVPPSHVFGTVHLPDVRLLPLPEPVLAAFAHARTFGMEHYPSEQAAMHFFDSAQLSGGQRLDELIGPAHFQRLNALMAGRRLDLDALARLKPWAALLVVTEIGEADGIPSVDRELYLQARLRRMRIEQLESVDEQVTALDGIPEPSQVALLHFALDFHDQLHKVAERTLRAYLERDLAALSRAAAPLEAQRPSIAPHQRELEKKIIHDRSVVMAHRMQSQLRYGAAFIAVGALHLYGEHGILALLEADGWQVRRVY